MQGAAALSKCLILSVAAFYFLYNSCMKIVKKFLQLICILEKIVKMLSDFFSCLLGKFDFCL